jgi:lysozyme
VRARAHRSADDFVFTQAEIAEMIWWRDAYERVRKGLPFMPSPVIDISHHNPTPDWAALKAGGVTGVIMKCTEGTTYADPTYQQRVKDASQAGLLTVPYHFLKHGDITAQMDWFLAQAVPPAGGRVVLDHEMSDCGIDELCKAVEYLWDCQGDLEITIYSGHVIKEQLGDNRRYDILDDTSLWIAQYTSASQPTWPKQQWTAWSLWQWTDGETVAGISQPVDGNKWNGSQEALVSFLSPAGGSAVTPQPEPDDVPEVTLDVTVSMSEPVRLRLIVNGEEVVTSAEPVMYHKAKLQ